ncbi:hypothetical protein NIES4103_54300 [Nostoc sp. NIES-4103]|nr:hypothetical protein NIES4103_54300 [Nostoc sp. NIES-4103]
MCRMILAMGSFSTHSVLNAALSMSEGVTASDDAPICRHPNGWGALWRNKTVSEGLSVHKDTRSFKESFEQSLLHKIETDFLVVHVRHATLTHNQGIEYTHPITQKGMVVPWYLFHNGFLPTVYQKLGLERSSFDSREYFDYIIPQGEEKFPNNLEIIEKLEKLAPGGSSANAIVVNSKRAYVIHWTPKDTRFPSYFTMYKLQTQSAVFIASEIIPEIASHENWIPLVQREIIELPFVDYKK